MYLSLSHLTYVVHMLFISTQPRRHAEVWVDTSAFSKVALGCLARCMQRLNGQKSFYVGVVVGTKRAMRPYKLGKKSVDANLQVYIHIHIYVCVCVCVW